MKNNAKTTNYFSAKLPIAIIIACFGVTLLGLAGGILCVWRIIQFGTRTPWDMVKYVVLLPVCAFCIVASLSIIFHSGYTITDTQLTQTFGLFRERFSVSEIRSALLNSQRDKLTLYTQQNQTVAVLIAPSENERFTRALMDANPNIEYGFTLADNTDEK